MLQYSKDATLTLNGRTDDALSFLSDFPNLTHLNVLDWFGLTIYDVSILCPKLRSLEFHSSSNDVSDKVPTPSWLDCMTEGKIRSHQSKYREIGFATSYFVQQIC